MCYKMVDEKSVFANNELSLRDIAVYGFDYDYTLAHYTDELNNLIYEMSLEKLIEEYSVSNLMLPSAINYQETWLNSAGASCSKSRLTLAR